MLLCSWSWRVATMEGGMDIPPLEEDLEVSKYNEQNNLPSCSSSETGKFVILYAIFLPIVN